MIEIPRFCGTHLIIAVITGLALILPLSAHGQETPPFSITSDAFGEKETIPTRFTCSGDDTSPALYWSGLPKGTVSLALVVDDPDASGRTWVHWVLYRIDPKSGGLEESALAGAIGALSGVNDFKAYGYRGPCPPIGSGKHRYVFTLYALSRIPDLTAGATKKKLLSAIDGITIGKTTLTGLFSR